MASRYCLNAIVLACLVGCASGPRGPEIPKVYENMDVTQRIDIVPEGIGSSAVLTEDGYILTVFHVAGKGEQTLLINIAEGGKPAVAYEARVVATDEKHDLALVKVDHHFSSVAVLGTIDEVHPGDKVYNIGYPYDLGRLASVGNVKAVGWDYSDSDSPDLTVENGLALDIANGPGTSGSGIYLAKNGHLVGLMRMVLIFGRRNPSDALVRNGRLVTVHVAISIDQIRAFLDRAHVPYRTEVADSGLSMARNLMPPFH